MNEGYHRDVPLFVASQPEPFIISSDVILTAIPPEGVGASLGDTFKLHSNPASTLRVFLDFDGHTTTGTAWNSFWATSSFHSPAFSLDGGEEFSASELAAIQQIWQRVA